MVRDISTALRKQKKSQENNNATSINDMIRIWHHIFFHVAYMGYCQYVQVAA